MLEQESWVAVDAPDEFQAIVDRFTEFETSGNGFTTSSDTVVRPDLIGQAVHQDPQATTPETTGSDEINRAQQGDETASVVKEKVISLYQDLGCFPTGHVASGIRFNKYYWFNNYCKEYNINKPT